MSRHLALAFAAGFLAVICFHQPVVGLLNAYGVIPFSPYSMTPVAPLDVPAWFSASFWGGVWGLVMMLVFAAARIERGGWWKAGLFGGIALTLVAMLVVFPLKGRGIDLAVFPIGFLVNGAWGIGTWTFVRAWRQ
ncbi:hypothetical protein LCL99_06395 [Halomonas denitrificans]|uniref:hypothetical protein n=1 Tax=Halomonas TaxID=2745 RepID=UPI001A8CDABA|nr:MULTISPECIES: hypothetical protein [Halomonas]MED5294615.1 hypothetical protein [Pseudomonadota bacterium]MBN8412863.1 hypothetical protein [Halomonas litopenaei]MBY5928993.1 hypothetical protein [Halomonas sp. DP8Y7-3]MBY5968080.1 hypothetical protein [Halomonas denitrificans]MBY5983579.1 hypothetical protein [Halomonas sp. DP5Y7-2]